MKDALKDRRAEHVIQGLAQTADTYDDAIECLLNQYDWPCPIHWDHICAISDVLSLKERNGKEIRCLHDVLLQHHQALKAMDEDDFETLLTAIVELERDWQCSSQEHKEVPPCSERLDFLNLRTCDSENSVCDVVKKCPTASNPSKGQLNCTRPAWRIVV